MLTISLTPARLYYIYKKNDRNESFFRTIFGHIMTLYYEYLSLSQQEGEESSVCDTLL